MAGTVFNILHRNWPVKSVGWYTWIFRGESGWFFLNVKERHVRFLCIVAAVGPASRILLWALKAGIDTQQANAAFLKLIELMFEIGGCSYAIWWFWSKITYV
ncbi:MAG: hypothetical protein JWO91_3562 [Acidobacteriaceae bacterium]|nr:hypothetical protein [Acidobacteriaceae bacterium]